MTDGQMLWLYITGGLVVSFFLSLLVGRFLKAGGSKPVPEVREPVRECEFWERAS